MTSRTSQALAFALLVTGCYPVVAVDDSGVVSDAGGPPPVATDGGDTLPCEVQAIVANRCAGCHGRPLAAPMALLTPADFNRPAPTTPDESVGWRTLARLRDPARPMPPSGVLRSEEHV